MEAGVQHRKELRRLVGARRSVKLLHRLRCGEVNLLVAVLLEIFGQSSDFSIEAVPTSIGCIFALAASISRDDGGVFFFGAAIDLIVFVEAATPPGWSDLDHFELVDFDEFVGFGDAVPVMPASFLYSLK